MPRMSSYYAYNNACPIMHVGVWLDRCGWLYVISVCLGWLGWYVSISNGYVPMLRFEGAMRPGFLRRLMRKLIILMYVRSSSWMVLLCVYVSVVLQSYHSIEQTVLVHHCYACCRSSVIPFSPPISPPSSLDHPTTTTSPPPPYQTSLITTCCSYLC